MGFYNQFTFQNTPAAFCVGTVRFYNQFTFQNTPARFCVGTVRFYNQFTFQNTQVQFSVEQSAFLFKLLSYNIKITVYHYLGLSQGSSAKFCLHLHTYQDYYSPG